MAKQTRKPKRYRPVGGWKKQGPVLEYGPCTTGCPTIETAIELLYKHQDEESFWTVMSALNYAIDINTKVLLPVLTAPSVHGSPAPWARSPLPEQKAGDVKFLNLYSDKDLHWLPVFTSEKALTASHATANCPVVEKTLKNALEYSLDHNEFEGVVLNPWTRSASLSRSILNGLLRAGRNDTFAGYTDLLIGRTAAASGDWVSAMHYFECSAKDGCGTAMYLLGLCHYNGNGVKRSRAEALRIWRAAADAGDVLSALALGDDCQRGGNAGKALIYYRRAFALAQKQPDLDYQPQVYLRIAQNETSFLTGKQARAAAMAAEAVQGLRIRAAEEDGNDDKDETLKDLAEAEQLLRRLARGGNGTAAYGSRAL